MDYRKVLRLHFVNKLSGREIAANCGCGKSSVNEFLRRFKDCRELSYPLSEDVTNEYIGELLYKKPGTPAEKQLYRDFDEEAVHKALSRKGETLKRQWRKYDAIGIVDGKRPLSYRQYCRRYSEWAERYGSIFDAYSSSMSGSLSLVMKTDAVSKLILYLRRLI